MTGNRLPLPVECRKSVRFCRCPSHVIGFSVRHSANTITRTPIDSGGGFRESMGGHGCPSTENGRSFRERRLQTLDLRDSRESRNGRQSKPVIRQKRPSFVTRRALSTWLRREVFQISSIVRFFFCNFDGSIAHGDCLPILPNALKRGTTLNVYSLPRRA